MKIETIAEPLVRLALTEDVGEGDVTTEAIIPEGLKATAYIVARGEGVLAGLDVARLVFSTVDKNLEFNPLMRDGEKLESGKRVCGISGKARSIVTAERVALNFLQRMSGVATLTRAFVDKIQGTGAKIADTRKTTPGIRILEKYAVKVGGGVNHRFGLFDMYLVKGNHVRAMKRIKEAVQKINERMKEEKQELPVEVEVRTLDELKEILDQGVDRIMLDNMDAGQMRKAVGMIREGKKGRVPDIEASGGVTLKNVRTIALAGVDLISVGALTHSPKAIDLSLEIDETWED
ncbi:MAG: carboxylating nicotinate-nucleotide diphosphorylase [Candidatus Eisenbacteria bacterium]|nr:carboxylating nicotinate-nucleotide diphosphorylase [Candidatus Eisenbacteria bacterium]